MVIMARIASVAQIKSQFSSFLKASKDGPIVVTRVEDEDEIERLLMAYSPRLQAILEASRKQIREGDVLSHGEFWREVKASRSANQHAGRGKAAVTSR
jgi:hypothetical protein